MSENARKHFNQSLAGLEQVTAAALEKTELRQVPEIQFAARFVPQLKQVSEEEIDVFGSSIGENCGNAASHVRKVIEEGARSVTTDALGRSLGELASKLGGVHLFRIGHEGTYTAGIDELIRSLCSPSVDNALRALEERGSVLATQIAIAEEQVVELEGKREDVDKMLEQLLKTHESFSLEHHQAKKMAQGLTLANYMEHFMTEARTHRNVALGWLLSMLACIATTVYVVFGMWGSTDTADGVNVEFLVARIVTISLILTAFAASHKQFSANAHNYVTNRHRANSLQTLRSFEGFDEMDTDSKKVMMTQVFALIFSAQDTGFSGAGAPPSAPSYMEIVNNLAAKSKSVD